MLVHTVKNNPVESNCYIIYLEMNSTCIIIDPGSKNSDELIFFLKSKNLKPEYIILTHEHFDHIWGINSLYFYTEPLLVASKECSEMIVDPKKNHSLFYDTTGFSISHPVITIESLNRVLYWKDKKIEFFDTPGHTNASISIYIDKMLFCGDLLIQNLPTITKLPGGSRVKLLKTLKFLKSKLDSNTKVFSGHNDPFLFKDYYNYNSI
jgi:glyoxylase-like metal-dependent hydrolase (beta-lactamase superfamily II)